MNHNVSSNRQLVRAVKSGLRGLVFLLMLVPLFYGATAAQAENDIEWIRRVANHHVLPAHAFVPKNALGPNGSVYLFGGTDGILEGQTPVGEGDLFIKNYGPDGALLWERQFGTTGADSGLAIAVDSTGIYVSGLTTGAFEGFINAGETDAFIARYDMNGNLVWAEQFGCADYDDVSGIVLTADGVFITGENNCALGGGTPSGGWDVYIRKYSLDGVLQWSVPLGTDYYFDESAGIAADASGAYWAGSLDANLLVKKFDNLTGNEVWSQGIQGTGTGNEQIQAISAYESNIFVAGSTTRTFTAEPNAGRDDAFLQTFGASDGTPVWVRQFGTSDDDEISALAVGSSGVYAGGYTRGALPGFSFSGGNADAYIKQYSLEGAEGWALQYGTSGTDGLNAIALSPEGIYLNGATGGALDGQNNIGSSDLYLKKITILDASPVWTLLFHPIATWPDYDYAYSVDANGNTYLSGVSYENRMEPTQNYPGSAFVVKYSPAGQVVWTKEFADNTSAQGVAAAADGYVYVTGSTSVPLNGEPGTGAFLAKYDPDGNAVWTRYFTGYFSGKGDYIAVDDSGVYLTGINGYAKFVLKYGAGGDLVWRQEFGSWPETVTGIAVHNSGLYLSGYTTRTLDGLPSAGGLDAFFRKYDLNGGLLWTRQFGTTSNDILAGIAVDDAGIYVTGETGGAFGGQANTGLADAFVQKFSLDGNTLLWTRQFGTQENDSGAGIAVDQAGVYVVGNTKSSVQSRVDDTPFLRVFSLDGEDAWSRSFNNQTELSSGYGVAVDAGGVYVSGNTWMWDLFYSSDATLIKISPAGNEAPVVGAITAPAVPVAVNTPVAASASFTDENTGDTHTATWDWGNGTTSAGTVTESNGVGTVSGTTTYTVPGVYEVGVTVTDQTGLEGSATYQYVVVYDPSAGFVTGGGGIVSPAGAYKADESLTGKATFGFVSKYQKGASVPTGNTAFQFDLAGLAFTSQSYEWLVVNQTGTNGQFKGVGMVNAALDPNGNAYKFMLWAGDGSPDTFRIRIWWEETAGEHVVYDNGTSQAISNGNIVIHTGK